MNPLSNITINSESINLSEEITYLLKHHLLPIVKERGIIHSIFEYVFEEITIFHSILFKNCIDIKKERNGDMSFLIEQIVGHSGYNDDLIYKYFLLTLTERGELSTSVTTSFDCINKLNKSYEYLTCREDKNYLYVFYNGPDLVFSRFENESEIVILTATKFDKKYWISGYNTTLLQISQYLFIIANERNVILYDKEREMCSELYKFESLFDNICSKIRVFETNFMIISCHLTQVIIGSMKNKEIVTFDLQKLSNVRKGQRMIISYDFCDSTVNERFISFCWRVTDVRYIAIVDIQDKKIRHRIVEENFSAMLCLSHNQVLIVNKEGKIVKYFL